MTMGSVGYYAEAAYCSNPAKWVSPEPILGKIYELCGIHRNSVDAHYKKRKSELRCIPITIEVPNEQ